MNRNIMLAAAAALAMGGAVSDGFGFTGARPATASGRNWSEPAAKKRKKPFKGSKAAKRPARRHK